MLRRRCRYGGLVVVVLFYISGTDSMAVAGRFVGLDLGTSGARISVIEESVSGNNDNSNKNHYKEVYTQALAWNNDDNDNNNGYDDAEAWMKAVERLFAGAAEELMTVKSICVSGTSASCVMVNRETQQVTRRPRMYHYDILLDAAAMGGADDESNEQSAAAAREALILLERHAPSKHTARARTGSLAKLLAWARETPLTKNEVLCHQSDYISMRLLSSSTTTVKSDWHNCLKLGFDVRQRKWPEWVRSCLQDAGISVEEEGGQCGVIPGQVFSPGAPMGTIDREMAKRLGLSPDTVVVGGTTDSNAAFFAAAGTRPSYGTAVTSLGSTLAMKQLSPTYIEDADRGVYSHRFPNFENPEEEAWLVGGASNVGCAILRELEFSNEDLTKLSMQINPMSDSPLIYYPLTKVGERFPIADSEKKPVLQPVPESRREYLHGLLQSIGDVEREGFTVLQDLGAPPPSIVWTCGGGSNNEMWTSLRERRLNERFPGLDIQVRKAGCTEASFGAALLAAATFH